MSGAKEVPSHSVRSASDAREHDPASGRVAELIRAVCAVGQRRAVRVVAPEKRGHIFFEQGHVVHAEFGEDVGLRAVLEMLRAASVEFLPCARPWPSQTTLFLSSEVVLAAAARREGDGLKIATEVRRKVQVVPAPPAGLAPASGPPAPVQSAPPAAVVSDAVASPVTARPAVRAGERPSSVTPTAAFGSRALRAPRSVLVPPPAPAAPVLRPLAAPAASAAAANAQGAPAANAQGAPAANAAAPDLRAAPASARSNSASVVPSPLASAAPSRSPSVAASPPPSPRPSSPANAKPAAATSAKPAAAVSVMPSQPPRPAPGEASDRAVGADAGAASERPKVAPSRAGNVFWSRRVPPAPVLAKMSELALHGVRPRRTLAAGAPVPPTTMVRVSARGEILAARGEDSERLADAAAFIYNQAKLIAADLGRHGRAAVHLRGGGLSLIVVKSEVNDVAAAFGSTERLKSLLRKVGFG